MEEEGGQGSSPGVWIHTSWRVILKAGEGGGAAGGGGSVLDAWFLCRSGAPPAERTGWQGGGAGCRGNPAGTGVLKPPKGSRFPPKAAARWDGVPGKARILRCCRKAFPSPARHTVGGLPCSGSSPVRPGKFSSTPRAGTT